MYLRKVKLKKHHEMTPPGLVRAVGCGLALLLNAELLYVACSPGSSSFRERVAFLNNVTFRLWEVTGCAIHCTQFKRSTSKHGPRSLIWVWTALHSQHLTFKAPNGFSLSYFTVAYAHFPKGYGLQMANRFLDCFHVDFPQCSRPVQNLICNLLFSK